MADNNKKLLPDTQNRARKRSFQPQEWKREKAKVARYSPKSLPEFPKCGHRESNGPFLCWHLTMNDMKEFHRSFYSSKKKADQDAFLLSYCSGSTPARKRSRGHAASKPKAVSLTYKVRQQDGKAVQVCREAFLGILGVKKDRILRLVKKFINTGTAPKENRGCSCDVHVIVVFVLWGKTMTKREIKILDLATLTRYSVRSKLDEVTVRATDSLKVQAKTMFDIEMFICEIKKRSGIYDMKSKDYSNRDVKAKMWEEVAMVMYEN
ncbi:uncharacterized protein LOC126743744 [Anthonomus grandis grandis]|uniref:uncharacterized protein LOC126743744 n=1 Tax=Anthonomus grandis grandis TaxID=2921223 RepID=UPI002165D78A|nr:uncharacterized protein LOC126743744 [Anthonomus grandis grandis]